MYLCIYFIMAMLVILGWGKGPTSLKKVYNEGVSQI